MVHLYETVNEGVIWSEIAHRCAELGNPFAQKAFDKEYLATLGTDLVYWRGQQEMMDFHMGSLPMSWDETGRDGAYEWISKEDYLTYYTYKTIDPKTGKEKGWNTPSKKVEPYSEGTLMLGRTGEPWASAEGKSYVMPPADEDYDPLIYYLEPEETNLTDTEYPIMLTQGRIPQYHHARCATFRICASCIRCRWSASIPRPPRSTAWRTSSGCGWKAVAARCAGRRM